MTSLASHRLDGLEPDNLLAFMALLGLLRSLQEAQPEWRSRVAWTVDEPPLRPVLQTPKGVSEATVTEAAAKGLQELGQRHEFGRRKNLKELSRNDATKGLREAANANNRYVADLWTALVSDAAFNRDKKQKVDNIVPTPLCLMFGQGHQYFLERLVSVPQQKTPPARGAGRQKTPVSESDCLREALFIPWQRPDATDSFRWDPNEDVRYAYRANDPTDTKTKERTQHGANRLAAVGLSVLTVVPMQLQRYGSVRLAVIGGHRDSKGEFVMRWPIWRQPISLAGIRALLTHPTMAHRETRAALGIIEVRRARRISTGRFMNFTTAGPETEN